MGALNSKYIFNLAKPCANRGISLIDNGNGTVTINGMVFDTMHEVEDYLEQIPRKDFPSVN